MINHRITQMCADEQCANTVPVQVGPALCQHCKRDVYREVRAYSRRSDWHAAHADQFRVQLEELKMEPTT